MLGLVLADYFAAVLPLARRELARWRRAAAAIPDPDLRRSAVSALTEKGSNPEAVAIFAVLAPWRRRRAAIGAIVALQVAIDYLDTLGEQPTPDPLRDGLGLHRALFAAVSPGATTEDWYGLRPRSEDGGYLAHLVAACQADLRSLPAAPSLAPRIAAAAKRCGEGQSHTHAAAHGDSTALERWARELTAPEGYRWWEVAAGACSSVAAHALIVLAARPEKDGAGADRVEAAYFPPIGALTVLLDDLVDRDRDLAGGEHNYTAYYADSEEMAERLASIAARADAAVAQLPTAGRHAAILDGVLGFYLGSAAARTPYAQPVRTRLLQGRAARLRPIALAAGALRRRPGSGGLGGASGP
jgi:tetraprenyl-beta-curcumene synthase